MAQKLVLIVDDDDDIRSVIADILKGEGYSVSGAANGLEALASVRATKPDLILLDLMMPVMNGWQFREEQEKDPALAAIPVVVLSAQGPRQSARIKAEAYIPKPFEFETLVSTVERCGSA